MVFFLVCFVCLIDVHIGPDDVAWHWDRDYGAESRGEHIYPDCSTVTYLTDLGGPTLVLDCPGIHPISFSEYVCCTRAHLIFMPFHVEHILILHCWFVCVVGNVGAPSSGTPSAGDALPSHPIKEFYISTPQVGKHLCVLSAL